MAEPMMIGRMTPTFALNDPVGTLTIEPLRLNIYASLLHAWIVHPRSVFWAWKTPPWQRYEKSTSG